MAITMDLAVRSQAKIKMAISGTSGSGKTLSSLLLAFGLLKAAHPKASDADIWRKICIIDTENKSGSLYVNYKVGGTTLGQYNKINLGSPFTPQSYMEAIDVAERAGIEFLIVDSLSHAWQGEGGLLDIQGAATKRVGNSYTAWREVTPLHNRLVDKIMQCDMHVCMNLRSKTEYVMEEDDRGRKVPRKIGMAPVFRDGIEFETTLFFELAQDHSANASKDRTGIFDTQYFVITPKTGAAIWAWLSTATPEDIAPKPIPAPTVTPATPQDVPATPPVDIDTMPYDTVMEEIITIYNKIKDTLSPDDKRALSNNIKTITNSNSANFKALGEDKINELRSLLKMFSTDYVH